VRRTRVKLALAIATAGVLGVGAVAVATSGNGVQETLTGYEEVPIVSTPGVGEFHANINRSRDEIRYRLTFSGLESNVTQSHIHFENPTNAGPIVAWLCGTPSNPGPAGTQMCPAGGGTITGVIRPANVGTAGTTGSEGRGISPGEFDEFVRAIRAGSTYVNVHTVGNPPGEIRAQLGDGAGRRHHGH
jgi:CHRD domain